MKAFDKSNRPFTAFRVIATLKITFYLFLVFCSQENNLTRSTPRRLRLIVEENTSSKIGILHYFFSVLDEPYFPEDILSLNYIVYPSFLVMNRIVARGTTNDEAEAFHFYLSAFFLFFMVGGSSNMLSSYILPSNGHYSGLLSMRSAVAASLGYCLAVVPNMIFVEYLDFQLRAADILFSALVLFIFQTSTKKLYGSTYSLDSSYLNLTIIPWVIGGIAGNKFGEYQLKRYYVSSFVDNLFR